MNCALWLNKRKVQHASEIPDNLDAASLRGYFLAGSLVEWLRENGGAEYAEKLSALSPDDPELNEKIVSIFGGKAVRSKPMTSASEDAGERTRTEQSVFSAMSSYRLPGGSFTLAEYGSGSFSQLWSASSGKLYEFMRKFGTSSFGSFNWGSFSHWEWLFALFGQKYGLFSFGSFTSFHEWEWEWEWFFRLFSSGGGSFSISGFGSFYLRFRSGFFGSFEGYGSQRSQWSLNALADPIRLPVLDEYDRIMLETLMRCPLDRFGYGVHNI